uniref:Putative secreted protein n=1 Tax=Anopheles darlingi TaxID=43151 RepID=A0A2M4DKN2_ANODA
MVLFCLQAIGFIRFTIIILVNGTPLLGFVQFRRFHAQLTLVQIDGIRCRRRLLLPEREPLCQVGGFLFYQLGTAAKGLGDGLDDAESFRYRGRYTRCTRDGRHGRGSGRNGDDTSIRRRGP